MPGISKNDSYKTHPEPSKQLQYAFFLKKILHYDGGCEICYSLILVQFHNEIVKFLPCAIFAFS